MIFIKDPEEIRILQERLFNDLVTLLNKTNGFQNYNLGRDLWYEFSRPIKPKAGHDQFINLFGRFDLMNRTFSGMRVGINFKKEPRNQPGMPPAGFFKNENGDILIGHTGHFRCGKGVLNKSDFFKLFIGGAGSVFICGSQRYAEVGNFSSGKIADQVLEFVNSVIDIKDKLGC